MVRTPTAAGGGGPARAHDPNCGTTEEVTTPTLDRTGLRRGVCVALILALIASACSNSSSSEVVEAPLDDDTTTSAVEPVASSDSEDAEPTTSTTTTTTTAPSTTESLPEPVLPATLWGVEDGTFDLVEVAVPTGEVLTRLAGWGADGIVGGGIVQALTDTEYANDIIWVGDCCEPAVGSVFRVDPISSPSVPEAPIRVNGIAPSLSADASLLAVSVLDIGVAIHDGTSGDQLIAPELVRDQLTPPDGAGEIFFATPLTWLDDATLAVVAVFDGRSTITIVNVEDLVATSVGAPIPIDGTVIDGTTRRDGALLVAVTLDDGSITGLTFDTEEGGPPEVLSLPAQTSTIDYDRSGTYLLVATEDGTLTWTGDGESGTIDAALVGPSWS